MLRTILICLLSAICPILGVVKAQEPSGWENRVNDLNLNRLNIGDFAVLFEATALTTSVDDKNDARLRSYVGRIVKKGKSVRMDCVRRATSQNNENVLYYHILQNANRYELADFGFGKGNIRTYVNEHNRYEFFERMDPMLQPLMPYIGLNGNPTPFNAMWADCSCVSENIDKADGRYSLFLRASNRKAGVDVTFAKEPEWAPVNADFYTSLGAPALSDDPKIEEYKKRWKVYSRTKAKWVKLSEETWVPRELFVTQCAEDEDRREIEIFFTDWKVGKDLDKTLLDEKSFTVDNIAATVDFGAWKQRLEAAHRK